MAHQVPLVPKLELFAMLPQITLYFPAPLLIYPFIEKLFVGQNVSGASLTHITKF